MARIMHEDDDKKTDSFVGHLLCQATSNVAVFIASNGMPAPKDTVTWSDTPIYVVECMDYVIGFMPNSTVEVVSLVDGKLMQKIAVKTFKNVKSKGSLNVFQKGASKMSLGRSGASREELMGADSNESTNLSTIGALGMASTKMNNVIIFDEKCVQGLTATPAEQQISECISSLRIEKGLQLLMKESPTRQRLRVFHGEAGWALYTTLYFKRAMDHFAMSDVDCRDIIYLFPNVRPTKLLYNVVHPSAPLTDTIHDTIKNVLDYRRAQMNLSSRQSSAMDTHSKRAKKTQEDDADAAYIKALYYLASFLWQKRTEEASSKDDSQVKITMDVALLKIYAEIVRKGRRFRNLVLESGNQLIEEELLRPPIDIELFLSDEFENNCIVEECEKVLIGADLYYALALLYKSKRHMNASIIRKSLHTLHEMGSKKWVDSMNPEYDGSDLTTNILKEMNDCQDLWSYVQWILLKHPKKAMNVFTDRSKREKRINNDKILKFLGEDLQSESNSYNVLLQRHSSRQRSRRVDEDGMIDDDGTGHMVQDLTGKQFKEKRRREKARQDKFDYVESFLEYLVNEENSRISKYHDRLALIYMGKLHELESSSLISPSNEASIGSKSTWKNMDIDDDSARKSMKHGRRGNIHKAIKIRQKLKRLLNKPGNLYTKTMLLETAKRFELGEEILLLNSKLGKHEEALATLVNRLNDHERAVVYCEEATDKKDLSRRFIQLIQIYIDKIGQVNGDLAQKYTNTILNLIETHVDEIDPIRLIQVMPKDIPIYKMSTYFKTMYPRKIHHRRHLAVVKNLYQSHHLRNKLELIDVKRNYSRIGDASRCPSCGRGFSASSVFILSANMDHFFHYSCFPHDSKRRIITLTGIDESGTTNNHLSGIGEMTGGTHGGGGITSNAILSGSLGRGYQAMKIKPDDDWFFQDTGDHDDASGGGMKGSGPSISTNPFDRL